MKALPVTAPRSGSDRDLSHLERILARLVEKAVRHDRAEAERRVRLRDVEDRPA